MKRLSNLIFYPALLIGVVYALYLWFSGQPIGSGEFVYTGDPNRWTDIFFKVIFGLVLGAYLVNVVDRYSGLLFFLRAGKNEKILHNAVLGSQALRWSGMTFGIGIPLALLCGGFLMIADTHSFLAGVVVVVSALEKLIYFIVCRGRKLFRAALTPNALVIHNGGLQIFSFGGLRSIDSKYDELYFVYNENNIRSVFRYLTEEKERESFFHHLELMAKDKNIPVSIRR
ncbi:MAG: hypothetical protein ACK40M_00690 [Flavobacteriales bacterium]